MLCNADDSLEKERHYLQLLEEQRVRGVLTYLLSTPSCERQPDAEDATFAGGTFSGDVAAMLFY